MLISIQNSKTELIRQSIKINGLRHIWDVQLDPDNNWISDLGSMEDIRVVDYPDSEKCVHIDYDRMKIHFRPILCTGQPEHHYFGVLVSFGPLV